MTPYYQDDYVTLYHGDCRELLPSIEADVVVTDPPYGVDLNGDGRFSRLTRNRHGGVAGDEHAFDPDAIISLGVPAVLFGANAYADRLPASTGWLVWDKVVSNDVRAVISDCELAWTNFVGKPRVFRHLWNGGYRASEQRSALHPTQKPVALMRWVIEKCPPGTILDPFAGSGTTLVAAKSLNRKAIGIEIEERYCEVAANRLRQEVLGLAV